MSRLKEQYDQLLKSGMFWELFPELTGDYNTDKEKFASLLCDDIIDDTTNNDNKDITFSEIYTFAYNKHKGQKDLAGKEYFGHLKRVSEGLITTDEIIVAYLHDVLEDTDATIDDLIQLGLSDEQITAIRLMTKKKGDNYDEYIDRIKGNKIARQVKIKDLEDNMDLTRLLHLEEKDIERLKKYHKSYIKLTRYEN